MGSQVLIFFKNPEFFPMIRQQQLTALDFISYCGGSLGLFLGFSVLSAVELVYFFTLRLIFKRVRSNKVECSSNQIVPKTNKNYLWEFVSSSSVHGCNQILLKRRHFLERSVQIDLLEIGLLRAECFRVLWMILVAVALFFCSSVTLEIFTKYKTSTIMIKYEDKSKSMETVCSITFNDIH
jgi:hypothetical protein